MIRCYYFEYIRKKLDSDLKATNLPKYQSRRRYQRHRKFSLSPQKSLSRLSSPEDSFNSSFGTSITYGSGGMNDTTSNSWWYQGHTQKGHTPKYPSTELPSGYSLRKRVTSRLASDQILSTNSLNGYLNKFEEQQVRMEEIARHESNTSLVGDHVMSLSNLSNGSGRSPSKYQAADDSVHMSGSDNDMSVDSSSFSPPRARDSVSTLIHCRQFDLKRPLLVRQMMSLLGINESRLNQCVENIRTWISRTILSRIVEEIDRVNGQLRGMGFIDVIGG